MEQPAPFEQQRKRRAYAASPDVSSAVGICAHETDMTVRQRQRLAEIAGRLGVSAYDDTNLCEALARALGDDWTDASQSAELFAAEEEARTAVRGRAPLRVPSSAAAPSSGWADLPIEMRAQVVRTAVGADPRSALALYSAGPTGAEAFDVQRDQPVWFLDEDGEMTQGRMPLADYARVAAAFGVSNPDDLFLAGATCTLQAFVNWYIANSPDSASPRIRDLAERLAGTDIPVLGGGGVDFAMLLSRGIDPDQLEQMDMGVLGDSVRGTTPQRQPLSLRQLRTSASGPLGESPLDVARQWYQFVTAPPALAANAMTPLAVRAGVILGGRAPPPFSTSHVAALQNIGLQLGDWSEANLPGDFVRLRRVLDVPIDVVAHWFDIRADDDDELRDALATWVQSQQWTARVDALGLLRDALDDGWHVQETIMEYIQKDIAPYRSGGTCAAVASRYPQAIPSFSRLFSGSRIMLEPTFGGMVSVSLDLDSDALDQLFGEEGY